MTTSSLLIIVTLWIGPSEQYATGSKFLDDQHLGTVSHLCEKYHARRCILTKEYSHEIDDIGFSSENRTAAWVLYGEKK